MLIDKINESRKTLVVDRLPIEVVAYEDGGSPLSLVLPPYEDLAEIESLKETHFSIKEYSAQRVDSFWLPFEAEKAKLLSKSAKFADSAIFQNRLANLEAVAGNWGEEERYLREASRLSAEKFYSNRIIENLIGSHRDAEAYGLLAKEDLESSLFANLNLAGLFARRDDIPEASRRISKALEIAPLDYRARLFDGALKLWHGDCSGALLSFRVASETRPNSSAIYSNMAVAYLALRKEDRALQCLKRAVAIEPLNLNAVTLLADVAHHQKQDDDAIPSLRYFARFEQKNATIWGRLARALLNIGSASEAIAALKRQVSIDNLSGVWNNLGVAYSVSGEPKKAIESYKQAMQLCSFEDEYDYCLSARNALTLLSQAMPPEATLAAIDGAIRPKNFDLFVSRPELSGALVVKFVALMQADRVGEAAKFGEQLLAVPNISPDLLYRMAACLLSLYSLTPGGEERALQLANQFAARNFRDEIVNPDIFRQLANNIAFVYAENGLIDAADQYLQMISFEIHKKPYPTATSGLLHLKKGHLDKAQQLYDEALRLCVHASDKARIRQKWNLEIGKTLIELEPKKAVRYLVRARDEEGAEKGLTQQASMLMRSLGMA